MTWSCRPGSDDVEHSPDLKSSNLKSQISNPRRPRNHSVDQTINLGFHIQAEAKLSSAQADPSAAPGQIFKKSDVARHSHHDNHPAASESSRPDLSVTIGTRPHLIPSRTQQLSSCRR